MIFVDYLPILMLVALALLLFSGFPVGGVLAGVGIGFALVGLAIGEFPLNSFFLIPYFLKVPINQG